MKKQTVRRFVSAALLCCLLLGLWVSLSACKKVLPTPPEELQTLRPSTAGEYAYFAAEQSNTALRIRFPSDWELIKSDAGYDVTSEGESVGTVTLGATGENAEAFTEAQSTTNGETAIKVSTGVYKRDGKKTAFYRVAYTYTDDDGKSQVITIEMNDAQMDTTAYKWLLKAETMAIKDYHEVPRISLEDGNGKKSIVMLGNSFLYNSYSGIAPTLHDLIAAGGKDCRVNLKGNGYASVSKYATQTDSDYKDYMDNIRAGKYGVVLMCGLYSTDDVAALEIILEACREGNAQLVIFPAHNEKDARIEEAMAAYPALKCLNWKARIEAYIDAGLTKEDFCLNDQHSHSNALAGYVGAALVYEALFGEAPPELPDNPHVITQAQVDAKLGGVRISPTELIPEKSIYYLGK